MAVAEHHQYITEIDLRGCEHVTDAALAKLIVCVDAYVLTASQLDLVGHRELMSLMC